MREIYLKNEENLTDAIKNSRSGDIIYLCEKSYHEKIIIDKPNLTIIGKGNKSIITFGDYSKKIHEKDGLEYNTFRSYTVNITASGVKLKNLTIENTTQDPKTQGQAVALSVYGDNFLGENLSLISKQDTLFCGPLPDDLITRYIDFLPYTERYAEGEFKQFFRNCKIYGSVDYVFGCGVAYFDKCKFINVDDGRDTAYVAAPAHSLKQTLGFTFIGCSFEKQGKFDSRVYLARPWRDYGKCTFINCTFGEHITQELFDKWGNTNRNRTARFELYNCSNTSQAVSWAKHLTTEEAERIKKSDFLNEIGWLCL